MKKITTFIIIFSCCMRSDGLHDRIFFFKGSTKFRDQVFMAHETLRVLARVQDFSFKNLTLHSEWNYSNVDI